MKIAVCYTVDPLGDNDGGRQRLRAFCRAFVEGGHHVTVYTPSAPTHGGYSNSGVEGAPIVYAGTAGSVTTRTRAWLGPAKRYFLPQPTIIGARSPQLSRLLSEQQVDLLLATDPTCAQYASAVPGARLWLDFSDLTSEVARRYGRELGGLRALSAGAQGAWIARAEQRLIARASTVSVAGFSDWQHVSTSCPRAIWMPTPVDMNWLPMPSDRRAARTAGFLANMRFAPNIDAVRVLCDMWAPELADAGWRVIVGGFGSDELKLWNGVESVGEVESPSAFYQGIGLSLAPVRLGGGIKVKVIEAVLAGRPVLSTEHAVEGIPSNLRANVEVIDIASSNIGAALKKLEGPAKELAGANPFARSVFNSTALSQLEAAGGRRDGVHESRD